MGITSAAEAKLDARIRPDITVLRSVTSYPRRHRPALAVLPGGREADRTAGSADAAAAQVARAASGVADREPERARAAAAGLATCGTVVGKNSRSLGSPTVRPAARSGSVRLTRRGKIVVGLLAVIAVASLAALVWLAVAGRAQAAGQVGQPGQAGQPGQPGSVGHSMLRVVVRPGESLWSIAVRTDPDTDPRAVIQQIIDDNALSGTAIRAGQVLWVPRV